MQVDIRVPATSANLGPGFDVVGVALNLFNQFRFIATDSGDTVQGGPPDLRTADHLALKTCRQLLRERGVHLPGLTLQVQSDVPMGGGLGSSSTCNVAGTVAARQLGGFDWNLHEIARLAAEFEGHPDNVVPAVFGGLTASAFQHRVDRPGELHCARLPIHPDWRFVAMTPDRQVSTHHARALLPSQVPQRDAVFNLGHLPLLLEGLRRGDADLVRAGCQDRLHQSWRAALIADFAKVEEETRGHREVVAVFISGAGPTVMALTLGDVPGLQEHLQTALLPLTVDWTVRTFEAMEQSVLPID
jgi:homoserine kinase